MKNKKWIKQPELAELLGITSNIITYNLLKFQGDAKKYSNEYILMNCNEKNRPKGANRLWKMENATKFKIEVWDKRGNK